MSVTKYFLQLTLLCITSVICAQELNLSDPEDDSPGSGVLDRTHYQALNLLPGYGYEGDYDAKLNAFISPKSTGTIQYSELPASPQPLPTIDSDLSVGAINYSTNISPTGAYSINIPVHIPKGTRGMEPALVLSYNSQGNQNGIAGAGWGIQGTSTIYRSSKSLYFDQRINGVTFGYTDALLLDGTRLVRDGGSQNWAEGSVYHPETGSNSRVISRGDALSPGSSEWFEVQTRDGLTHEYGKTENARVESPDGKVYSWHLNKSIDQYGNYISYIYKKVENQIVLEEVLYTGGNGFEPYNRIVFGYNERQDHQKIYLNGTEVLNTLILRDVTSYSKENIVRKLKLNYQMDSEQNHPFCARSFLTSIDEFGFGLTQINSMFFQYSHDSAGLIECYDNSLSCFPSTPTEHQLDNPSHLRTGDFNGDGFTDLIGYNYDNDINDVLYVTGSYDYNSIDLYLNDQSGGFDYISTSGPLPDGFELDTELCYGCEEPDWFTPLFISHTPDYRINSQILDLNGDGKQDLVIRHNEGGETHYTPWISTGAGFVELTDNANILQNSQQWSMVACDLNGDGVTEMLSVSHEYSDEQAVKLVIFDKGNGEDFVQQIYHSTPSPEDRIHPRMIPVDIDGDGADEILTWRGPSYELQIIDFLFGNQHIDEDGVFHFGNQLDIQLIPTGVEIAHDMHIFPGDINGDGRSDFLVGNPNNGEWHTFLNKHNRNVEYHGPSFVEVPPPSELLPFGAEEVNYIWTLADMNADGASEIIWIWDSHIDSFTLKGEEWESRKFSTQDYLLLKDYIFDDVANEFRDPQKFYNFADFNGDGTLELVIQPDAISSTFSITPFYNTPEQNLISSFRNSLGHVTNINYEPLTSDLVYSENDYDFLENEYDFTLPYKKQASTLFVVESAESLNHVGELNKVSYKYVNALFHTFGKGFSGFSVLQNYNHTTDTYHENHQSLNLEFDALVSTYSKSYRLIEVEGELVEELIGETTMLHDFVDLQSRNAVFGTQNLRYRIDNDATTTKSYVTGEESTTTRSYDNDGNITSLVEAGYNNLEETTTTYGTYNSIDDWWIPTLPPSKTVSTVTLGENSLEQHEDYLYFGTGAIQTITSRPNTNSTSTEAFLYNSKGLKELITISGNGVETTTEEYVYTPDGRNLHEFTNALGMVTTYIHSDLWGTVTSSTDQFGRQKTMTYDAFGKTKKKTDYMDRWHSYEHEWAENVNGQYTACDNSDDVVYRTIENAHNGRSKITSYSRLQKPRLIEESAQFDVLKKVICYDELGRVTHEDVPYFEGDLNVNSLSTVYDEHNRVEHVAISSRETDYTYALTEDHYKITQESNIAGTKTSFHDFSGMLNKNTDPGGDLEYEYFSGGLAKYVKYNDDIIVEHTYDEFGRKTSITDVNAGTFDYDYDTYDRLIFESDDRNNETTTVFNNHGQVDFKMVDTPLSNGIYDYEYYLTGTEIHKLKKETAPSGNSTEYFYDDNDQIVSVVENIDGVNYINNFEFDDHGNLTRKEYPSEFAIRYNYDEKGFLQSITNDNGDYVIWEIGEDGVNSQGQMEKFHLGNDLTVDQDFDANNFPELVTVSNTLETIFSFNYLFDENTGNLKSRNLGSTGEYFAYDQDGDDLNRLSGKGPSESETTEVYFYDENGNIVNKDNVGPYQYHNQKKNAVIQIDIPALGIPQVLTQFVTYNHFNSASEIKNLDDQLFVTLDYGPDDQRRMAKYWDDSGAEPEIIKTRIYAGSYEKQINPDLSEIEVHYISAGGQLVAMYVLEGGVGSYYYPHLDHLGSIIHVTDELGDVVFTQSFDAWGRTRNPEDHSFEDIPQRPDWFWRGYTGHEHLDEFGLINMNGRLYDPVVGRMLSPDNYIQKPDFTQSYNRYSYVWNNPLKYNDPDGEWVHIAIGAAVGGVINLATNWNNIDNFWEGAAAFGVGAGAGALTAATGGAAAGTFMASTGAALGAAAIGGAATGATNNIISQTGNGVGLNQVDWGQVGSSSAIGGVAGLASYGAGTWASNNLANPVIGSMRINSPMLAQGVNGMVSGAFGGAAGGFTGGFLFSGGDLNAGWQGAWQGIKFGGAIGAGVGLGSGYAYARKNDLNIWNGEPRFRNEPAGIQESMALDAAKNGAGSEIMGGKINDPYFKNHQKMQYVVKSETGQNVIIHYWRDPVTGALSNFKFKNEPVYNLFGN